METKELDYSEIANKIKDYFENKYSGLSVRGIEFSREYDFHNEKTEKFKITYHMDHGNKWIIF